MTSFVNGGLAHWLGAMEKRLIRSSVDSAKRIAENRRDFGKGVDSKSVTKSVESLTKPKSPGGAMRKAAVALIAAPDPVTTVSGVALLATSFALRKKEPMSLGNLAAETRKLLRDMESFTI